MSRTDGRKLVAIAVTGIVGVLGIAQFYLPYMADRDKLRGLFEEEGIPEGARREMEMMSNMEDSAQQTTQSVSRTEGNGMAGSMWKNFKK